MDVFSHLSDQAREDITWAAQTQVRNIHYRKIRTTLGMEERLEAKVEDRVEDSVEVKVEGTVQEGIKSEGQS